MQLALEFAQKTYSVSELTSYLKKTIKLDPVLGNKILVEAEVSNLKKSSRGHVYFTLKDENASINGVMWGSTVAKSKFSLEEGMAVICTGELDIYAPSGTYSLVVKKVEPVGLGALQLAYQQLKERFEEEGLFEAWRKQELPEFPMRIGIITAQTGAVIHDMMRVIRAKNPYVEVILAPAKVQGDGAAEEIAACIEALSDDRLALDAIIVGRGGGSFEDLFCFSEEPVVRAIAECAIPIVAGIGHEPDYGLADAVADYTAATPTMAAEHLIPDAYRMLEVLTESGLWLSEQVERQLLLAEENLSQQGERLLERVKPKLTQAQETLNQQRDAVCQYTEASLKYHAEQIEGMDNELQAVSPMNILKRGYCVLTMTDSKTSIRSVDDLDERPPLMLTLGDGSVELSGYCLGVQSPVDTFPAS